jgi:hypothetical protein
MAENNSNNTTPPKPEMLRPQTDEKGAAGATASTNTTRITSLRPRTVTHRPSHKATFIGVGIVVVVLIINIAVILYFVNNQNNSSTGGDSDSVELSVSTEVLNQVGVSRSPVGSSGVELLVNPNAKFGGTVTIGGAVSVAESININGKLTGTDATITNLQAGNTAVEQININGDATATNMNLRNDLTVVGVTRLQGATNMTQLLTVENNVNISGSLSVGGALAVRAFQANSLVSETTLTIGGHIITRGTVPTLTPGGSLGMGGTVSISGNDAAGTIAVNIGTGGGGGVLASVAFRNPYSTTPRVIVSAATPGAGSVYATRTSSGFSVGVNGGLGLGTYVFDYIVVQ